MNETFEMFVFDELRFSAVTTLMRRSFDSLDLLEFEFDRS